MAQRTFLFACLLALAAASSESSATAEDTQRLWWHALPWWGWTLLAIAAAALSICLSEGLAGRCSCPAEAEDEELESLEQGLAEQAGAMAAARAQLPALLTSQSSPRASGSKATEGPKPAQEVRA
uniref:Uncharacterized protein n=1 Tax=Alexandrium andersonii TaxID=327968 RepID=A0A7S2BG76_9DINO|mmetsp:Transcript_25518/g.57970  ORF Transcript_25518/g.57970 Transcript_25518/m.57970 type:complete len:125 (+) Transcript_25518:75-449(+)